MVKFKRVAPQIVVPDVVSTAGYYRDELGFKILGYFADPPVYAMVERDEVEIHFGKADEGTTVQVNEALRKGLGNDFIFGCRILTRCSKSCCRKMFRSSRDRLNESTT